MKKAALLIVFMACVSSSWAQLLVQEEELKFSAYGLYNYDFLPEPNLPDEVETYGVRSFDFSFSSTTMSLSHHIFSTVSHLYNEPIDLSFFDKIYNFQMLLDSSGVSMNSDLMFFLFLWEIESRLRDNFIFFYRLYNYNLNLNSLGSGFGLWATFPMEKRIFNFIIQYSSSLYPYAVYDVERFSGFIPEKYIFSSGGNNYDELFFEVSSTPLNHLFLLLNWTLRFSSDDIRRSNMTFLGSSLDLSGVFFITPGISFGIGLYLGFPKYLVVYNFFTDQTNVVPAFWPYTGVSISFQISDYNKEKIFLSSKYI